MKIISFLKWRRFPAVCALVVFLGIFVSLSIQKPGAYSEYNTKSFGLLPVQVGGRIKPLNTVARVNLMLISDRQSLKESMTRKDHVSLSATEWFMDVAMRPERANDYRVFRIVYPEDLGFDGLREKKSRYFSFNEMLPYISRINQSYQDLDPNNPQNAYEKQIIKLHESLANYQRLLQGFHPLDRTDTLVDYYAGFEKILLPGLRAFQLQQSGQPFDESTLREFMSYMLTFQSMGEQAHLRLIPPESKEEFHTGNWANIGTSLMGSIQRGGVNPYVISYARLTDSFRSRNPDAFNDTVEAMLSTLEERYREQVNRVHFEHAFNAVSPFIQALVLYLIAFLLTCIAWFGRENNPLSRVAFWLVLFTFLLHTFGLLARMYIQGRPPVTNLYASAVFVGWGAVLLCILLERVHKNGIGNAAGALIGSASLIIAHNLATLSGDTLGMVQAVLDSNFWLSTHVVVITLGYSAMFVAGALALLFIIRAVFTPRFDQAQAKKMGSMVYAIICFAALFSLVGTILGGIWADQSWGRFWGWDPKENGALLIVITTAIILHVRWGGLSDERGIMNLVIFGNIVTSWSWFGTNMLGVGLHSYGFMDSAFIPLVAFWISQSGFILLGSTPPSLWLSQYGKTLTRRRKRRAESRSGAPAAPGAQAVPKSLN